MITNKDKRDQLNELGATPEEDMKMSFYEAKELVKELKDELIEHQEADKELRQEIKDFIERLYLCKSHDDVGYEIGVFEERIK